MILVTGGTGLLGSHLLIELCEQNDMVSTLIRKNSNTDGVRKIFAWYNKQHLYNKIRWIEGDINDVFSLEDALKNIQYVYHCAALVSFNSSDRVKLEKTNQEGTANVVNACLEAGIKKLCHVSSTAAIGKTAKNEIITEKTPWKNSKNNSYYSITKYNAEREVWRGIEEGLDAVIVNPSVIIGPGNWNNSSNAIFKIAFRGMPYYTEGSNAFVDARDVAKIMIALMNSPICSERYLTFSENIKFRELFSWIAEAYGNKPPYIKTKPWMSHIAWRIERIRSMICGIEPRITKETAEVAHKNFFYCNKKIKTTLNYNFISVKESVMNACRFYLNESDNEQN